MVFLSRLSGHCGVAAETGTQLAVHRFSCNIWSLVRWNHRYDDKKTLFFELLSLV